ncbi:MAG: Ig-like domain-containing protein [Gemmatimonadales bacterium]
MTSHRVFSCTAVVLLVACHLGTEPANTPAVVRLSRDSLTLSRGAEAALAVEVLTERLTPIPKATVRWSSDAPLVAQVLTTTGVVYAEHAGSARIRAESGTASAVMTVTVIDPDANVAAAVAIQTGPRTVWMGEALQLSADVENKWGEVVRSLPVTWSSANDGVATVTPDGRVQGVAHGTVSITAASGSASSSVSITVFAPGDLRIAGSLVLVPGSEAALHVEVVGGVPLVADAYPTVWSSSDPTVASVSPDGTVTGGSMGTATITASTGHGVVRADVVVRALAGRIAYSAVERGRQRVMLLALDGTAPVEVPLPVTSSGFVAALSPDGARIAFDCGVGVCWSAVDDSFVHVVQVTIASEPSWTRDGLRLAFMNGASDVSVLNVVSGAMRSVHVGTYVGRPRISPDGSRIVVACSYEDPYDDPSDLCSIALDGTSNTLFAPLSYWVAWSPDGSRVSFTTDAGLCVGPAVASPPCTLVLVRGQRETLESAWSPDASHIVVARSDGLWLMEANGDNQVRLALATRTASGATGPTWGGSIDARR